MLSNCALKIHEDICAALPKRESYGLHEPCFNELEEQYLTECIRSGWVSYQGAFVRKFEQLLAKTHQCQNAIAVSNGTTALFVALYAMQIERDDEVLVPSLTFVATANAVSHIGAIPHLVESYESNLGIDVEKLDQYLASSNFDKKQGNLINTETGNKVTAIIPVHVLGHPIDMEALLSVAKKYNLKVIEDAAESLGSLYKNRPVGCYADIGITSFNGNKIATTGGGGAILVNDNEVADRIRHITTTAKLSHKYEFIHDVVGYNYRMPNVNAAIGVAQLEKLPTFLKNKRSLAAKFEESFANNPFCTFISEEAHSQSNYWLNAIILKPEIAEKRDEILDYLHSQNIFARPLWRPMHMLDIYKNSPKMERLDVAEDLYKRVICIPSSVFLYEDK